MYEEHQLILMDPNFEVIKPRPRIENKFEQFLQGRKVLEQVEQINDMGNEKPCTDESFDCIIESTVPNDDDYGWSTPAGVESSPGTPSDPLAKVSQRYMVNGSTPI
jgi:hypothetical protein